MNITLTRPHGLLEFARLWRLYLEAFPASERKPFALLRRMSREGTADFWNLEADGRFAGLAFVIRGDGIVLLDYFAVAKNKRGGGVGTAALAALLDRYRGGFFLEIESTLEEAKNAAQRRKRKAFYLGCGLKELHTEAMLFGVRMELLGIGCTMSFDRYREFYRRHLGEWAAGHVAPVKTFYEK